MAYHFFLFVTILLASCIAKQEIKIQESKVIGYHFDLEDKKKMEQPYVARFKKGKKELIYVLAKHVSDKDYPRLVDHPTNITIRRLFAKYNPQVVIVEGIPDPSDFSPDKVRAHLEK